MKYVITVYQGLLLEFIKHSVVERIADFQGWWRSIQGDFLLLHNLVGKT